MHTYLGDEDGKIDANDETNSVLEYSPFIYFSAVPVFPPTLKPSISAKLAVPSFSVTTFLKILFILLLVLSEINLSYFFLWGLPLSPEVYYRSILQSHFYFHTSSF